MSVWAWVLIALAVVLVAYLVFVFNGFIRKRNRTQEAWAQIDVELKRRHDLIPNLVESVRGYAAHERQALDNVPQARAAAVTASASRAPRQIAPTEEALSQILRSLMLVAENYP